MAKYEHFLNTGREHVDIYYTYNYNIYNLSIISIYKTFYSLYITESKKLCFFIIYRYYR